MSRLRSVSAQEFSDIVGTWNHDSSYETPHEDMLRIEDLLGLAHGTLDGSHTVTGTPTKGGLVELKAQTPVCKCCQRHLNWYDVIHTGIGIHSATFMADVLCGKKGYFIVESSPTIRCSGCNTYSDPYGYECRNYACKAR